MNLILRGTEVDVVKPDGQRITMRTRRHLAFGSGEGVLNGYHLYFKQDGYTMIVFAGLVQQVRVTCPECKKAF